MIDTAQLLRSHRPEMTLVACQLADHTPDFEHECLARQCSACGHLVDGFSAWHDHVLAVLETNTQ